MRPRPLANSVLELRTCDPAWRCERGRQGMARACKGACAARRWRSDAAMLSRKYSRLILRRATPKGRGPASTSGMPVSLHGGFDGLDDEPPRTARRRGRGTERNSRFRAAPAIRRGPAVDRKRTSPRTGADQMRDLPAARECRTAARTGPLTIRFARPNASQNAEGLTTGALAARPSCQANRFRPPVSRKLSTGSPSASRISCLASAPSHS